jgi:hypothetical protein
VTPRVIALVIAVSLLIMIDAHPLAWLALGLVGLASLTD